MADPRTRREKIEDLLAGILIVAVFLLAMLIPCD